MVNLLRWNQVTRFERLSVTCDVNRSRSRASGRRGLSATETCRAQAETGRRCLLLAAGSLRSVPRATWTVTIDPEVGLDPATGETTITGTLSDCHREVDVFTDPEIELTQGGLSQYDGVGFHCTPGEVTPWSKVMRAPFPSRGAFQPGPAYVQLHTEYWEPELGEAIGHTDFDRDVTIVERPAG